MPDQREVDRAASLEVNFLRWAGILPGNPFEGARISGNETNIVDIGGALILKRKLLRRGGDVGFMDIAAQDVLGSTLVHVCEFPAGGAPFEGRHLESLSPEELFAMVPGEFRFMTKEGMGFSPQRIRLCAYSPPKIGLEIDGRDGKVILDLGNWRDVPPLRDDDPQFGYWSYRNSLSDSELNRKRDAFEERVAFWTSVAEAAGLGEPLREINKERFELIMKDSGLSLALRSCKRIGQTDCLPVSLEVQGQVNEKWCVPASVCMALSFRSLDQKQEAVADKLGLLQRNSPITLPLGAEERISGFFGKQPGLDAKLDRTPEWRELSGALAEDAPVVNLIKGHARLAVGFSSLSLQLENKSLEIRGLVVFDPWPANQGRILHWESFEAYTHKSIIPVIATPLKAENRRSVYENL